MTLFKAAGDNYAFIEAHSDCSSTPPTIVRLAGDHYDVLKEQGIAELATAIDARLSARRAVAVPGTRRAIGPLLDPSA